MKKVLLVLSAVLLAAAAQAMPAVGDSVTKKIKVSLKPNKPGEKDLVVEGTVKIDVTAYDEKTQSYSGTQSITTNGQTSTKPFKAPANAFVSDAVIDKALAECSSANGVKEVVTIAGKTVEVCKAKDELGDVWIGKVPLAYVYITETAQTADGLYSKEETVIDFALGK